MQHKFLRFLPCALEYDVFLEKVTSRYQLKKRVLQKLARSESVCFFDCF